MSNIQRRSTRGGMLATGEPPVKVSSAEFTRKFKELQARRADKYGHPNDTRKLATFWGCGFNP